MLNGTRSIGAAAIVTVAAAATFASVFGYGTASATRVSAASTAIGKCAHPKTTTVKVSMFEYGFTLSPKTAQCGTITFKQKNDGHIGHNFDITGHRAGKLLQAGGKTSFTVKLLPGKYPYLCDVLGHASLGMLGTLTVK